MKCSYNRKKETCSGTCSSVSTLKLGEIIGKTESVVTNCKLQFLELYFATLSK